MQEQEVLNMLKKTGAVMSGHFLLSSGNHSSVYIQCAKLFQFPGYAEEIGKALAEKYKGQEVDVVLSAAIGGNAIAQEVARALKIGSIRSIFAEKESSKLILRRGFNIDPNEKVLIVEDVVTTTGTTQKLIDIVSKKEAELIGCCTVVDRSEGLLPGGLSIESLLKMELIIYNPKDCPLCKQGIPLARPGSSQIPIESTVKITV